MPFSARRCSAANFRGAILAGSQLVNATLTDANMSGANLGSAILDSPTFTDANLTGAIYNQWTIFPAVSIRTRQALFSRSRPSGTSMQMVFLTAMTLMRYLPWIGMFGIRSMGT